MRISREELLALTPADWAAWYDTHSQDVQREIVLAVGRLTAHGLSDRQAMVAVYALVEEFKLAELDRLYNLPHTVN